MIVAQEQQRLAGTPEPARRLVSQHEVGATSAHGLVS
jgi:hypothetical protein